MNDPVLITGFYSHPVGALVRLLPLQWIEATNARKEFFMSDVPREYTYGTPPFDRTYYSQPITGVVEKIRDTLNADGSQYNVCFLNRYDEQKHQLGWHADDSPEMDRTHPIAVVSFGAERDIWTRPLGWTGEIPQEWRYRLPSGSLFIMPAGFQDTHQHRIPKSDRPCGVRISLTFRHYIDRKPETVNADAQS